MVLAEDIPAKIAAGQAATVNALRFLADQIERLPVRDAAEVLNWLAPHVDRLEREAERILHVQPFNS